MYVKQKFLSTSYTVRVNNLIKRLIEMENSLEIPGCKLFIGVLLPLKPR
ncbi:hypothetical protein KIS1582_2567 [Cytobacillus firmus]|uniref:Uncharacterized protein n=1 Tax=Cytobacillus firmus TaxID=1399 RepID=A0A800MW84_CYTFI|nr:hypothetical protein KIS1582_2567 [Cytobacillus firmus]